MKTDHQYCDCCRSPVSRRDFIAAAALTTLSLSLPKLNAQSPAEKTTLIDIHMHHDAAERPLSSAGTSRDSKNKTSLPRGNEELIVHQKNIGALVTVLLGANDETMAFAQKDPPRWVCFTRAAVDGAGARETMERSLKRGAIGIGELKNAVACDSPGMEKTAELARDYDVPMLIHFEDGAWNDGFKRFYRMVEKFPTVKFIGHGQTWWAHIDSGYTPAGGMYPKGPVKAGGLTDRWLADYPNLHCDLSAGSGNNGLMRDQEFARAFVIRHRDKIMFGSDCPCLHGVGPTCISAVKIHALEQLELNETVRAKILRDNARRLLKLQA